MRSLVALLLIGALAGCASPPHKIAEIESSSALSSPATDNVSAQDKMTRGTAPIDANSLIVALPFQNLSGKPAPLAELRGVLINDLEKRGLRFLDDKTLEEFMKRHRIRYTGGISERTAELLRVETGADAVLITSMELYKEEDPPKIAVASRLVRSGLHPQILWMDNSALTGDESPGLLGLGLIEDRKKLVEKAFRPLADSLARYIASEEKRAVPGKVLNKYAPKTFYRSPMFQAGSKYTVAVIPFYDVSGRKGAGEIVADHFVEELLKIDTLTVIEPGVVRQELLKYRVILDTGVSLADADLLFDKLGVDLVVSGRVFDYQGYLGVPKVDFSVEVIERSGRRTVWSSRSYNKGDEGVFFFDVGRVSTAHSLTSKMVYAVTGELFGKGGEL